VCVCRVKPVGLAEHCADWKDSLRLLVGAGVPLGLTSYHPPEAELDARALAIKVMMIVYPRETPPQSRTARARPPAAHHRRHSRPHHRRHGVHSPTAHQPHSNGLCSPPKEDPGPGVNPICLPPQGAPPHTQQPTWPTAHTAHSQHCGHTALPPGQKTNPHGEHVFTFSSSLATGIRIAYSAWFLQCLTETCTYSSKLYSENRLKINRIPYSVSSLRVFPMKVSRHLRALFSACGRCSFGVLFWSCACVCHRRRGTFERC